MKAKTHKLVEQILASLAPIFKAHPDYSTILEAMSLVMARVIQATPDKGNEHLVFEDARFLIQDALEKFVQLEKEYEAQQQAKKKIVESGINGFDKFAEPVIEPEIASPDEYIPGEGPCSEP
jgi:hypothetical protein